MKRALSVGLSLTLILIFTWAFGSKARAQGGIPLTLPLFLNNNSSCQDENILLDSYTVTCGRFTDDIAAGHPDFPDCVSVNDLRPEASSPPPTSSIVPIIYKMPTSIILMPALKGNSIHQRPLSSK